MKFTCIFVVLFFLIVNSYGQWKAIQGPDMSSANLGQDFSELTVNGDILCAIINGSVHISYNNGQSWMYASGVTPIYAFVMSCSGSNIYIGNGGGVYMSKNYGSTYEAINSNLPNESTVEAILVSNGVIIAAIQSYGTNPTNEVCISDNNGQTWSIAEGLSNKFTKCLKSDGINIYAATQFGVYRSTDNGKNWSNIGLADKPIFRIAVKNNMIFAAEGNSNGSMYLSSDSGKDWSALTNNGLTTNSFSSIEITDNSIFVASGWDGAFRSDNNGLNWTKLDTGTSFQFVNVMASKGDKLITGFNNGISISDLNSTSLIKNNVSFNLDIRSIAISGSNLLATTNQGINISSNEGLTWDRNYIDMSIFETIDSIVYIGGENGFYRSDNFGNNLIWQDVRGLPFPPKFTDIVASGSAAFASLYGHGVYFSNDFGWNWSAVNSGLTSNKLLGLTLVDSTVFAASDNKGVFRSIDFGKNWSAANNGLGDSIITCLSGFRNTIYAGTSRLGIFKSADNGDNWVQIQNVFSNSKILCLYSYGSNIFVGVEGKGLYLSTNNGSDWIPCNTGLLNYNINSVAVNDTKIYLGTNGGAIWERPLADLPLSLSVYSIKTSEKIVCEGSPVVLTAYAIGGKTPYTYKWSEGRQSSVISVNPVKTTTYEVKVTDAGSITVSYDVTIWVKPKPKAPVISMNGDTLISNYLSGNIWMIDGSVIYAETSNKILPKQKGKYTAYVNIDGCKSDVSESILVAVNKLTFTEEAKIFPNPANDIINVEMNQVLGNSSFSILNIQGQVVLSQKILKNKTIVQIGNLPPGIYFMRLVNNDFITNKKILIE